MLTIHRSHVIVVVLTTTNLIAYGFLFGYTLMHRVVRIERSILSMVDVKHWGKFCVVEMKAIEAFTKFKQKTKHRMGFIIVERPLMTFVLQ